MFRPSSRPIIGLTAVMLAGGTSDSAGQAVVPVHQEPRHRLMYADDALQILDVRIEPGDTTLFHRHDVPIAYVEIAASVVNQQTLGGEWGRVEAGSAGPRPAPGRVTWNERYADEPVSHRVTALGPGPFRLIGVLNPGTGSALEGSAALGPFDGPDAWSRYFRRSRRELRPDETLQWTPNGRPVVLVASSDEVVTLSSSDGPSASAASLQGPGSFAVLAAGRQYLVTNRGEGVAVVSFVELR